MVLGATGRDYPVGGSNGFEFADAIPTAKRVPIRPAARDGLGGRAPRPDGQGAVPGRRQGPDRGEYEGFCRVVAHAETSEVLGVHLIGPHTTGLIVEPTLGVTLEVTAWEMGAAMHPHPTLSEAVGEAAMAVDGRSINF